MSYDGNNNWVEGAHTYKKGEYYYIPVIELRGRRWKVYGAVGILMIRVPGR